MNVDSAIEALVRMKGELKDIGAMANTETTRLNDTKKSLVDTFAELTRLLTSLLNERKQVDKSMQTANKSITAIDNQGATLRQLRNSAAKDITNWTEILRRMRDLSVRFGNMLEEVDLAHQDVWDTMNGLRDSRFNSTTYLDDELRMEDLFAEEQKQFEMLEAEVKKRSERIIVDALKLNIKSELELQTNKMFEELEEWRKQNDTLQKLPQRKRRLARQMNRQRSNN